MTYRNWSVTKKTPSFQKKFQKKLKTKNKKQTLNFTFQNSKNKNKSTKKISIKIKNTQLFPRSLNTRTFDKVCPTISSNFCFFFCWKFLESLLSLKQKARTKSHITNSTCEYNMHWSDLLRYFTVRSISGVSLPSLLMLFNVYRLIYVCTAEADQVGNQQKFAPKNS